MQLPPFRDYITSVLTVGEWAILACVAMGAFATVGVVCVWAVSARRHWFIRVMGLGSVIILPTAVGGYDIAFAFLVQCAFCSAFIVCIRARLPAIWPPSSASVGATTAFSICPPRFSLADLLLATAVVSACLAVAVRIPIQVRDCWQWILAAGLISGGTTSLAIWAACSKGSLWSRLLAGALAMPSFLVLVALLVRHSSSHWGRSSHLPGDVDSRRISALFGYFVRVLIVIPPAIAFAAILAGQLALRNITPSQTPTLDIISEARGFAAVSLDPDSAGKRRLEQFVTLHEGRFRSLRAAFEPQGKPAVTVLARNSMPWVDAFLCIERALEAEGRLAEMEGRYYDAAQSYMDLVRIGRSIEDGSMLSIFHMLAGTRLEDDGLSRLSAIVCKLNAAECSELAADLRNIQSHRPSLQEIATRDLVVATYPFTWRGILVAQVLRITRDEVQLPEMVQRCQEYSDTLFASVVDALAIRKGR